MGCSRGDGEGRLRALIHEDATPLKVLLSVLALSVMERVSLSMGEETVQSIRVCRESMATGPTEPCAGGTTSLGDSGVAGGTISVTGRIVGLCTVVATMSTTTGLKESSKDLRAESVQGRGEERGEIFGLGRVGDLEGLLLPRGRFESDFGEIGESVTRGTGEYLVGLGKDGSILDSVGGQELTFKEAEVSVELSVTGTGGGVNGGGRLSCIDGASGSAKVARVSARLSWGDSGEMLRSTGSGDSNTELGLGSMIGVVEMSNAAGMGAGEESTEVADSFVAVDSLSFISGMAESVRDFTDWPSDSGGSLAKSGSVTSGVFCEEVEDRGRVLLACMMPSSLRPVIGMLDKDEAERPSGSF